MRSDLGEMRKRDPAGFPNGLDMGHERKKAARLPLRFSPEQMEGWT